MFKSPMHAGIHTDYHYEAIMATVDPESIRTEQRIAAGEYKVNGFDMDPPSKTIENGKKLVEYRANLTVDAIRKAIPKREATGNSRDKSVSCVRESSPTAPFTVLLQRAVTTLNKEAPCA